jgi:transcription initiation factor IIF auxiliary subunit
MNNMKYAVVITTSFDIDVPVYLFDDCEKAIKYLHDLWEDDYNTELAESIIGVHESQTYHEEWYAKITWRNGDTMEYYLTDVIEPIEINGKSYR